MCSLKEMGASSTSLKELQSNHYLQALAGTTIIAPNDDFWDQLLSFSFISPHNCADCRLIEDSIKPMLDMLLTNNAQTGNVAALINVFLIRSMELKEFVQSENRAFVWRTYNSLIMLRAILKYFIETLGEDSMLKHLSYNCSVKGDQANNSEVEKMLELLINALFGIIVDVPLSDITHAIILEAANTLLVLLSVQMFSTRPAQSSIVYKIFMQGKCSIHAYLLVKTLLLHYINQDECPHCLNSANESNSIIIGIASSLWNILTFSYVRGSASAKTTKAVLANQSLLLLLALVNHCTNEKELKNPYREALFSFQDSSETTEIITHPIHPFKLDYKSLFFTLCNTLKDDQTTLLVYLLLHKNPKFKQFILTSVEIESLIVPILKILYNAPEKSSHHIYMALIVLLILSEDENFDKSIHSIKLKNVFWYTERNLSEISVGGLIILILVRTIQYNMTRMHDKYLHTNCLAALANMSAYFQNLHPYVCQKLITLLEHLAKRHSRVAEKLKSGVEKRSATGSDDDSSPSDLLNDSVVLEEVIRMLLEIINSCLSAQLKTNTNLLYAMLYHRHVFEGFHSYSCFEDIMQNIDKVVMFVSQHLQTSKADQNPSVMEVSQVIQTAALHWSKDKLRKFPELKFKYVEEGQPEDFFVPYLWSLVFHASDIYWNSKNILLFNPHKAP